jgi:signal transduction histidine kinase
MAAFLAGQVASELRAASLRREAQAREEQEQRMLTEERLRIARELHDVISHSIATIGVQAGVAAHVLDEHPEQAREALLAIKAVSRDAMRDLRGMLGVLRQSGDPDQREPAPGLARLPELVEQVRGAGLAVQLAVEGTPAALTPATDLAAYRVVQEALTNVIRHAPGASAEVHVQYAPECVQIEVLDDGRAPANGALATTPGTGHGLNGLRERALALGGTLQAGQTGSGGFRVLARLPTSSAA